MQSRQEYKAQVLNAASEKLGFSADHRVLPAYRGGGAFSSACYLPCVGPQVSEMKSSLALQLENSLVPQQIIAELNSGQAEESKRQAVLFHCQLCYVMLWEKPVRQISWKGFRQVPISYLL